MSGRSRRPALVHAAHIVHGGALLLRPAALAARVGGVAGDRRAVAVVRVLGARHLAQGSAGLVGSGPSSSRLGAVVDGLHAASMVGLAVLDREHRRAATTSALMALAFALAGRWAGREAD